MFVSFKKGCTLVANGFVIVNDDGSERQLVIHTACRIRNNQNTLCSTRPRFNPCLGQPAWCYRTLFHLGSEPLCLQYIPTFYKRSRLESSFDCYLKLNLKPTVTFNLGQNIVWSYAWDNWSDLKEKSEMNLFKLIFVI